MSAIGSLFSSSSSNNAPAPPPVSSYQPPNPTQQVGDTTSNISTMGSDLTSLLGQYLPFMNTQTGANTAGASAGSLAAAGGVPGATNIGMGTLTGGANLIDSSSAILNTAFDPQSELYAKLFQQNQDQANVTNSMYGVQNTPYGAGVADQANTNFNIDWQNQQLARQIQGLNAAGTGYATAAPLGLTGQSTLAQAAELPFATTAAGAGANTQAVGQGIQETSNSFQPTIQDLLSYLGWGTGATSVYNQGQTGAYGAATTRQDANTKLQTAGFNELGDLVDFGTSFIPFPA
jgi:hypothetical protein